MICLMCLKTETPSETDQACEDCMKSLQYAEDLIKRTGVGLKVTYNQGYDPIVLKRGDLSKLHEKAHWTVEMTALPDMDGTLDQPVYEGKGDLLKDACEMAWDKLKKDLE